MAALSWRRSCLAWASMASRSASVRGRVRSWVELLLSLLLPEVSWRRRGGGAVER